MVLQHANIGQPMSGHGKLAANWEGLYKVTNAFEKAAYKLEILSGSEVLRTWHAANLKKFYA